jgi:hypothetical protein
MKKRPVAGLLLALYSPECVEGAFSELRAEGVLRSCLEEAYLPGDVE